MATRKKSTAVTTDAMTKARVEMVLQDPFFGTLLLRTKTVPDDTIKTAAVNGVQMKYNPEWFSTKLDTEERRGVLAHEIMHIGLMHHTRRGSRDPEKWNIACDYAINALLRDRYKLPQPHLYDAKYAGMSAEEIYAALPDDPQHGSGRAPDQDPGGCGGVEDAPRQEGESRDSANKRAENEAKQNLATAAHVAKMQGNLPAFAEELVAEALEPIVPWKDVLRRFCTEKANPQETWANPDRRFVANNVYLPGEVEEDAAGIAVIIRDTSGSIYADKEALAQFNGEIDAILTDVKPTKTYVIDCDADVAHVEEIEHGEPMPNALAKAHGGGGTDFRPPFVWLEEQNIKPKFAVYLTDGYGTFPDENDVSDIPTLWVMTTDVVSPVGETVELKE